MLVLEGTDRVGGGQQVTLDVVSSLGGEFDFSVAVPISEQGQGALRDELHSMGIEVHLASYPAPAGKFGALDRISYLPRGLGSIRRLVSLIRRTEPGLLYATSRTALWASLAGRVTRTPVAVHLHMVPPTAKTAWFLRRVCAMKPVSTVLVASPAIAERISLPETKVRTVPNGIDGEAYRPRPALRDEVRSGLGARGAAHLAAVIGELSPEKGQLEAILALKELVAEGRDAVLVVIGSARTGNERYAAQLRDVVSRHGLQERVIFTGQRTDVSRLLNGVDLLVVPSRGPSGEASPMVVLEAWATGVPVLASNTGGLPEMLATGRGALFDVARKGALAHEWQRLIDSPERRGSMCEAGLKAVSGRYSRRAAMERVREALEGAMSGQADQTG